MPCQNTAIQNDTTWANWPIYMPPGQKPQWLIIQSGSKHYDASFFLFLLHCLFLDFFKNKHISQHINGRLYQIYCHIQVLHTPWKQEFSVKYFINIEVGLFTRHTNIRNIIILFAKIFHWIPCHGIQPWVYTRLFSVITLPIHFISTRTTIFLITYASG